MSTDTEQKYILTAPQDWANSPSDAELLSYNQDTDFSKQQLDEGKDYCYFFRKTVNNGTQSIDEHLCMTYSLSQPANLESNSVREEVLYENETLLVHRIAVIREGVLIDKMPDTKIKVLDSEDNSSRGVIDKTKKVNFAIKDLRLYDILIIENTRSYNLTEKDFVRKEYSRHILVTPDTYWAFGHYEFNYINNGLKPIAYRKYFFRDENQQLIQPEKILLNTGDSFQLLEKDYLNTVDPNREIYPFIDFATDSEWKDLSNFIYPIYKEVIDKEKLEDFAPDLKKTLDELGDKDKQIQYAIEYVQNSIRYIYNAEDMHGHKPQEASVTYTNKQGDCKAKNILLKVILDYLGVESDIILVNYNTDFYFKYYLPSLLAFNHVILKIKYKGEEYLVDATLVDEYGLLENRSKISLCHYLEINPDRVLEIRPGFRYPKFCFDENVSLVAKDNVGELTAIAVFRYHRANNIRKHFKNTNKREIIDSWLNYYFDILNYCNDRNGEDVRKVFKNVELDITEDNKDLNQLTIRFYAKIDKPYFTDLKKRRFLMYFDRGILKYSVQNFNAQDYEFWHNFDSERHEIYLSTDLKIDTKEKYTIQECTINNPYFTHSIKKNITNHSGTAIVEYNPLTNVNIPLEDMPKLKEDCQIMHDSNFGLGIDIIEPGFMNQLKFALRKLFKS